ncbi:ribonuclease H-like domain-containing protein [Tanacetum coccineum]
MFLGDNLLSWSAKRQHTISRSSAEAEYRGVANVVAETTWIRNLLCELHSPLLTATLVYYDNISEIYMSANLVQHQRTKHIEIDIHFVRDMVKVGHVRVLHVPSHFQYANIFTKGLPSALFEDFRSRLFLSQKKYARQLLERAHMVNCNPSRTPIDTDSKLGPDGVPVQDPTLYRSLAGGLQYLTFTRPDLSYAVQQVCLYMHDPREPHFAALKRILRYVQGTLELGLQLYASATTSLVGYTDADWAGCPSTRRSTSGYCVFLGDNLLSWSAKRQHTISRSSAEAEYRGVANVVAETAWIRNLLRELHSPLLTATLVYCDNVSAIYMSANPVQHQRTKHIEIDIHFVRDMVKAGHVRVLHVPSRFQYANIFTKGLPSALFEDFGSSLSVRPPPAPTAGAY